jgi:hypothetical protein
LVVGCIFGNGLEAIPGNGVSCCADSAVSDLMITPMLNGVETVAETMEHKPKRESQSRFSRSAKPDFGRQKGVLIEDYDDEQLRHG